jgi:DNA-binding CsgD family transcriptional regulator
MVCSWTKQQNGRENMEIQRTKDDLIRKIYGCLLGENSWQEFLDKLCESLPDGRATLFFHDAREGSGAFTVTSGIEKKFLRDYSEYFSSINPWMPGAAARPLGLAVPGEYMLGRSELQRTEYYADFLQPQGISSAIGVTIWREQSRNLLLSVTTGEEDERRIAQGTEVLQALVPHLAQAFGFYRRQKELRLTSLAEIPSGIAFISIDENRKINRRNAFAEDLLSRNDGVWVDGMGRFCSSEQRLTECIVDRMAPRSVTETAPAPVFVVRRKINRFPLRVQVVPSPMTGERGFFAGPECKLLIEDTSEPAELDVKALRSYFSLTAAEAGIVQGLVHGRTVVDIASRARVAPSTVRTQLRHIYAKMEVNRQASVVQLARAFELGPYNRLSKTHDPVVWRV